MALHMAPVVAVAAGSTANAVMLAVEAASEPSIINVATASSQTLMASALLYVIRCVMTGSLVVRQAAASEAQLKQMVADAAERERLMRDALAKG